MIRAVINGDYVAYETSLTIGINTIVIKAYTGEGIEYTVPETHKTHSDFLRILWTTVGVSLSYGESEIYVGDFLIYDMRIIDGDHDRLESFTIHLCPTQSSATHDQHKPT